MKLKDYINPDKLAQYISDGIVDVKAHPTLPLSIYCYSRKATFDNIWDDVTGRTRGLIVDSTTGEVIARPFEKFFNLGTEDKPETWPENLPHTDAIWLDKLDGSLGILWTYDKPSVSDPAGTGTTGIATKGSFVSDHAIWATTWYHKNVINPIWPAGYTPVFEIIAQSVQTHVVLYDIPDQLVLLALINNETGEELDYNSVYHYSKLNGLNTVDIYATNLADAVHADRENKEGYVASWPLPGQPPLKIKVKHKTFLKLQKIVHAATPKKILEALINKDYETLQAWEDGLSFELAEYVRGWRDKFAEAYSRTLLKSRNIVEFVRFNYETRKEQAAEILSTETKLSSVVFAMLDGQAPEALGNLANVSKAAWKIVTDDFKDELLKVREDE